MNYEDKSEEELTLELAKLNRQAQSLRLHKAVLDQLPVATIIYDQSEKVVYRNKASEVLTGYEKSQLLGISLEKYLQILQIKPSESVKVTHALVSGSFKHGIFQINECTLQTRDGTLKTVLLNGTPFYDEGNNFLGGCGCAIDVSSHAQTEKMFQLLAENARDMIYRYRLTPEHGFEYVSPACTAITGYTPEDFYADINLPIKIAHPDDRPMLEKQGFFPHLSRQYVIMRHFHKDGRLIWAEGHGKVVYNEANLPVAIEGIIRDITEQKIIELALQKSKQLKALILDSMMECIVYHDAQMRINWANKATGDLCALQPGELVGRHCYTAIYNYSSPCPGCPVAKALSTGLSQEGRITSPDGRVWLVRANPVLDGDNKATGVVEVALDITRLTRAEQALRESEERFRIALKNSPIVVFNQDLGLRYTWIYNPHPGLLPNAVLGKTDAELLPPRNSARLTEIKQQVIKTGTGLREEVRTTIGLEAYYYDLMVEPLRDPYGIVTGVTCVSIDITEDKRATEALRQSEERFHKVFNLSPVLMSIRTLKDQKYIEVNRTWQGYTGYHRDEVIGHPPPIINLAIDDTGLRFNNQISSPPLTRNRKITYRTKSGEVRTGLKSTEILEINGEACILSVIRDITELQRTYREMARLDRLNLVSRLSAGIGHEIRNPLATVKGFLQLLGEKEYQPKYVEYYNLMLGEVDRADTIITDFLNLAQNSPQRLEQQNLNCIITSLQPLLISDAALQNKYLTLELGTVTELLLDGREIRQLLLNLVRNGLEAMSPGQRLTIRTYQESSEIVLSIQDQGKGIDPSLLGRLGTPFLITKEAGTGLGLSVCYSIATRHNAVIEVDTGPTGTTVNIRFKQI